MDWKEMIIIVIVIVIPINRQQQWQPAGMRKWKWSQAWISRAKVNVFDDFMSEFFEGVRISANKSHPICGDSKTI